MSSGHLIDRYSIRRGEKMYRVFLTRTNITVQMLQTESQAEKVCEEWGWKYDGSEGSGFIDYEGIKEEKENV